MSAYYLIIRQINKARLIGINYVEFNEFNDCYWALSRLCGHEGANSRFRVETGYHDWPHGATKRRFMILNSNAVWHGQSATRPVPQGAEVIMDI